MFGQFSAFQIKEEDVAVSFQMYCMYIKFIVCILNLVFLGMPRIFILYVLRRNYVLDIFLSQF